jgi:SAM-dependent methyltransferase
MDSKPDYLGIYQRELQGDFYGPDYYRHPQSEIDSAIIYDDGEDKRTVAALLVTSFAPRRALEVGCATGLLIKALRGYGVQAEGFDFSHWCIENADPQAGPWVRWGDVLELPVSGPEHDLVLALDVLEHLPPEKVPLAIGNLAAALAAGGILFTVIPAYGPNRFGPELFPLRYEGWRRDAARGVPFTDLPLDDRGRPHLGHLTHATIDWWEKGFRRGGLRRLGPVERLLHRRYDAALQLARRSFFVLVKAGPFGGWRAGRRLSHRIAAVPGLPRGFWSWERWDQRCWMRWTNGAAWEPVERKGRALELQAICNHPDIAQLPVEVTFQFDGLGPQRFEFRDHDWHRLKLETAPRRFAGLAITTSRTWAPDPEAPLGSRRELGVGISYS